MPVLAESINRPIVCFLAALCHPYFSIWTLLLSILTGMGGYNIRQVDIGIHYIWLYDLVYLHPTLPPPSVPLQGPLHNQLLRQEITLLLNLGAIEPVTLQHKRNEFYSSFFLIPKKNGDWKPILDLRQLNKNVRPSEILDGFSSSYNSLL